MILTNWKNQYFPVLIALFNCACTGFCHLLSTSLSLVFLLTVSPLLKIYSRQICWLNLGKNVRFTYTDRRGYFLFHFLDPSSFSSYSSQSFNPCQLLFQFPFAFFVFVSLNLLYIHLSKKHNFKRTVPFTSYCFGFSFAQIYLSLSLRLIRSCLQCCHAITSHSVYTVFLSYH